MPVIDIAMVALGFLHRASGLGETVDSGLGLPRNNVIVFDVSLVAILVIRID